MGDGGKLYQTYTPEMADGMARLCRKADIVVPNMTEACHLLGRPYNPGPYTREEIREIMRELCAMGPSMAVLTGVWLHEGTLGTACYDAGTGGAELFLTDRIEGFYHGTGDLFASALLGGLLNGASLRTPATSPRNLPGAPSRPLLKKAPTTALAPNLSATCPGWRKKWKPVERWLQIEENSCKIRKAAFLI